MQKFRRLQMFIQAVVQGQIAISCSINVIYQSRILKGYREYNIFHFSLLISIISLTTRITQQYLRRAKSGRNYKYSKKNKKFEDLSHEEKLLIFYPKFSLANLVEIMREDELLKKKLYNVYARSQVKLTYCYIIWIWIFIFISFTTIIFNHGIMTIARTQPNYGFIPKKKLKI